MSFFLKKDGVFSNSSGYVLEKILTLRYEEYKNESKLIFYRFRLVQNLDNDILEYVWWLVLDKVHDPLEVIRIVGHTLFFF